MAFLGGFFCLFPYTQIIPLGVYTQPYALLFCFSATILLFRWIYKNFPATDFFLLVLFFLLGVFIFLATCFPYQNAQEYKYLLVYISPVFYAATAYYLAVESEVPLRKLVTFAAVAWIVTGIIQTFYPSFATGLVGEWSSAGEVVVASGRGVLGLAPEPTHYGFHLIFISAALLLTGGSRVLSALCIISALLVARSASVMLVLALAGAGWSLTSTKRFLAGIAVFSASAAMFLIFILQFIEQSELRILFLLVNFIDSPLDFLALDASVNARLGGIAIGFFEIIDAMLVPNGMSWANWLMKIPAIEFSYKWLFFISTSGIPSGYLIVIYQTGVFGLLLIAAMIGRAFLVRFDDISIYLVIAFFLVFMFQIALSSPSFGFVFGLLVAARKLRKPVTFFQSRHRGTIRKSALALA